MEYINGAAAFKAKVAQMKLAGEVAALDNDRKAFLRQWYATWAVAGEVVCDCPDLDCRQARELNYQENVPF